MGKRIKIFTAIILFLGLLMLSLPVFGQTEAPKTLEQVKNLGIKALNALPAVVIKVLREGWAIMIKIWQQVWYWLGRIFQALFGGIWQEVKSFLGKTFQERKVIFEQGLREQTQEAKNYFPATSTIWQNIWNKIKEITSQPVR